MFSLVTACMNREAHLRQSLTHWLTLEGIREIIVVDWSNANPLIELTKLDGRIKVIRVEGEPRWILSCAYNLGIARAGEESILKCDADCLPSAAVLDCRPGRNFFFAGHWKSGAAVGKGCVNGQCVVSRQQFERVNGYSEIIRSYGRDDEDFYDRLIEAGFERREINPAEFHFVAHSDVERMQNQVREKATSALDELLERNLTFNEMRNFFLGRQMPWGPWFVRAPYEVATKGERFEVVRRDRALEVPVPAALESEARLFALRYLVRGLWGLPATVSDKLEERACLGLLTERLEAEQRAT
jgi:hypothetical protein